MEAEDEARSREMAEAEAKRRHEEEPEPDEQWLHVAQQPAKLANKRDTEILSMMERCIAEMDNPGNDEREQYFYRRARCLAAYLNARNVAGGFAREDDF